MGIGRANNGNVRQRTKGRNVFEAVVSWPETRVSEAATDPDDDDGSCVVTNVDLDLFIASIRNERRDGVGHRAQPSECQPRSRADHVGFGNPAVIESLGEARLERIEEAIADVAHEEDYPVIVGGALHEGLRKCVSHGRPSSR
jgi:hypothetical protein